MKWLKTFEQHNPELDFKLSYDELINASSLVELDFESVFDTYDYKLERLMKSPKFLKELSENDLVADKVQDSKDIAHLLNTEFKCAYLNTINDEETNIEVPKYILIQPEGDEKIHLYYTTDTFNRFHEKLGSRIVKLKTGEEEYSYVTYNAGKNWKLQNSEKSNERFPEDLSGEALTQLLQIGNVDFEYTN